MSVTSDGLWAVAIFLGLLVAFVGPLLYFTSRLATKHARENARAVADVLPDKTFSLNVSDDAGGSAYLYVRIDGDTDFEYDIATRGVVESEAGETPFAWRTAVESTIEGASEMAKVTQSLGERDYAEAFVIAEVPRAPCRVRGEVLEGRPGLFVKGHVYVPAV